jgi:methyl-accepting chemotaxis protein
LDNPRTSAAVAATPAARPSTPRGRGGLSLSLLAVLLPLAVLPLALFALLVYRQVPFNSALAIAAGVMVISLLGIIFVIRRITVPLQSLTDVALGMPGGDLAPDKLVSRSDELGQLAAAFNRQSAELRGSTKISTAGSKRALSSWPPPPKLAGPRPRS